MNSQKICYKNLKITSFIKKNIYKYLGYSVSVTEKLTVKIKLRSWENFYNKLETINQVMAKEFITKSIWAKKMIMYLHKQQLIKIKQNQENFKITIKYVNSSINQHGIILFNI